MGSGREFFSDLFRGVGTSLIVVSLAFIFLFLGGAITSWNIYFGGFFVGLLLPLVALIGGAMFLVGLALDRKAVGGKDLALGSTLANGGSPKGNEPEVEEN